ncbi:rhomboid family intramembrane serine protease [Falsiporphyromonas endometrii]|uniref:Rhomboid family intramembrane serine protease n=1 Tax=Falsiporphyromonas endometrii TaxID=1387297 RepID=A0ABV9K567_9PORP
MFDNSSLINRNFPPATKHLIIINVVMWVASIIMPRLGIDLIDLLGLHYFGASKFNAVQLVTNMFLHDTSGFGHIFFNMFSLWMFGRVIEQAWGSKRYLLFYMTCGLTASFLQELVWYFQCADLPNMINIPTQYGLVAFPKAEVLNQILAVGASGAVFGLLLAFGMILPNAAIYLFFVPIPIKAKYFVIGYGLIELFYGVSSTMPGHAGMDNVAHFAHLGGMIGGLILILIWRKKGIIGGPYN